MKCIQYELYRQATFLKKQGKNNFEIGWAGQKIWSRSKTFSFPLFFIFCGLHGVSKLHGHSNIFFLGVNQSGPKMSSTTNHNFFRALGQLNGPWC